MSSSHAPAAPNSPRIASALAGLHEFLTRCQSRTGPAGSFLELEKEIGQEVRKLERAILAEELERYDIRAEAVAIEGDRHEHALRTTRTYWTAAGPVHLERSLYQRGKRGVTACPLELGAGIIEGRWTPLAARQAAWGVAMLTPGECAQWFELMGGLTPSRSSLERFPKSLSSRWEADREAYEDIVRSQEHVPAEAVSVSVSLDGVMVPMRDVPGRVDRHADTRGRRGGRPGTHREASVAALTFYDEGGESLRTIRWGRMPESKKRTLKSMVLDELGRVLAERDDLKVVKVADGALDNWEFLCAEIPVGAEVVDFYHAAKHLRDALEVAHGEGSHRARSDFEKLRTRLLEEPDGVERVIRALRHLLDRNPRKAKLKAELKYFRKNRERMAYAVLREENLPIGSGPVEAACKTLVTQRLKRSGMRWDEPGGQAVITLRSLVQSDRFEPAMAILNQSYQRSVRPLAA